MSPAPEIVVTDFVAGARRARGVAIVIDVFRACSLQCYAIAGGVRRIVPVQEIEAALALGREHPDWLLAGERYGRPLPGFRLGNYPAQLAAVALTGRTLVHTTHAGTQGLCAAAAAGAHVLTGALVNAGATVRRALELGPAQVSIVRMGHQARERCAEDDLCAELLLAHLAGAGARVRSIAAGAAAMLRDAPAAAKFFDPEADWAPQEDFALCTAVDRFDFAIELTRGADGLDSLERVRP
jgi:2-phosphosulfolactate phosphatase